MEELLERLISELKENKYEIINLDDMLEIDPYYTEI